MLFLDCLQIVYLCAISMKTHKKSATLFYKGLPKVSHCAVLSAICQQFSIPLAITSGVPNWNRNHGPHRAIKQILFN